jgi:hypothetical protein
MKLALWTAPLILALTLAGCGVVTFSKAGESDAQDSCVAFASASDDSLSVQEAFAIIQRVETAAVRAAEANDDYALLRSAATALKESMFLGSLDLAQSAWTSVRAQCLDLFG